MNKHIILSVFICIPVFYVRTNTKVFNDQ